MPSAASTNSTAGCFRPRLTADYGFIPHTLGEDGDALDALVLLEDPTFPGCWIPDARPVGILWMEDEKGHDAKIVCVLDTDPHWSEMKTIEDFPPHIMSEIEHFFDVYKMLEPNKTSSTQGHEGVDAAWREIDASLQRAKDQSDAETKPDTGAHSG